MGQGCASAVGASFRNLSICKRDNASAILFLTPAICMAVYAKLCVAATNVNLRISLMMSAHLDLPLFRMWTAASLSQWKDTLLLDQCLPHRIAAMKIGYNSLNAICPPAVAMNYFATGCKTICLDNILHSWWNRMHLCTSACLVPEFPPNSERGRWHSTLVRNMPTSQDLPLPLCSR